MRSFLNEARPVMRRLLRSPMFTAVTLLTLAVGIGANTAIFSVLSGVLLKPLPYPNPDQLVGVWETAPGLGIGRLECFARDLLHLSRGKPNLPGYLACGATTPSTSPASASPNRWIALDVTDGLLPILGVRPIRGRWFTRKDDSPGSPKTVMLAYGYWQRKFGGDAIRDRAEDHRRRGGARDHRHHAAELPLHESQRGPDPAVSARPRQGFRRQFQLSGQSRASSLAVDTRPSQCRRRAHAPHDAPKVSSGPGHQSPKCSKRRGSGPNVRPLKADVVGDIGKVLWVLMATVGAVLFIACANVANLYAGARRRAAAGTRHPCGLGSGTGRASPGSFSMESVALGAPGGALGVGARLSPRSGSWSPWARPIFRGSMKSPSIRPSCCLPSSFRWWPACYSV